MYVCVCVCVRACVLACVRACGLSQQNQAKVANSKTALETKNNI